MIASVSADARIDLLPARRPAGPDAASGSACFSGKWPVQRKTSAISGRSSRRISVAGGRVSPAGFASPASARSSKIARRSPSSPADGSPSAACF